MRRACPDITAVRLRKRSSFLVILLFILVLGIAWGISTIGSAKPNDSGFVSTAEKRFDETRRQFFKARKAQSIARRLRTVIVDDSHVIHMPQEPFALGIDELEPLETSHDQLLDHPDSPPYTESLITTMTAEMMAIYPSSYNGPFSVGDIRSFRLNRATATLTPKDIDATLVGQGSNINIWLLKDADYHAKTATTHTTACRLTSLDAPTINAMVSRLDSIYGAMTNPATGFGPHANVTVTTPYANLPTLGDMGGDGKVNFILYDIGADGTSSGSFIAGFFSPADFQPATYGGNQLDLLHIDIGNNQGYRMLTGSENDQLNLYGTLAHEFQHLLHYTHFGVYEPESGYDSDLWFNESLSELAGTYFVEDGLEVTSFSRLLYASLNTYDGSGYRDFVNHSGLKNYGMGMLFSCCMYKTYANYQTSVYRSFMTKCPRATTSSQYFANRAGLTTMQNAVGDALKEATGVGSGGTDSLSTLYFLFMEAFAADGGTIHGSTSTPTTKLLTANRPIDNLWAIRPVIGMSGGAVSDGESGAYNVSGYSPIPSRTSGSTLALLGFGSGLHKSATHENLSRLSGADASTPYLVIKVTDANPNTRYYVALANDATVTSAGPSLTCSGINGADLYPLTPSVYNVIDTQGKTAYLFVTTFYRNVNNAAVTHFWRNTAPVYHTLALDAAGGSVTPASFYAEQNTVVTLPTPTRQGYTFEGWFTQASGGVKATSPHTLTSTMTLYAQWSIATYTITFDAGGGTVNPPSITKTGPGAITLPTPVRAGYSFWGWFNQPTEGLRIGLGGTSYYPNSDITLYAQWMKVSVVTYDANGGSVSPQSQTLYAGTTLASLPTPTRTGYTFRGWYTAPLGGLPVNPPFKPGSDVTLYAQWTPLKYTIKYYNGTTLLKSASANYDSALNGGSFAPAKTGYTFAGWYTATSGGTKVECVTKNQSVYARYTIKSYTVKYYSGSTLIASSPVKYKGAPMAGPAKTGYTFVGWYTAKSGGTKVTSITKNQTLYARYTIKQYTTTYYNGSVLVRTVKSNYNTNVIAGPAKTGYTFAGWYTAKTGGTKITKVTANRTLYAQYTIKSYAVNYYDGATLLSTAKVKYKGAPMAGPAKTGYTFNGWYTAKSGGTKVTSITKNQTLYARYTIKQYTTTYYDGTKLLKTVKANYNTKLMAGPVKSGCLFEGWFTEPVGGIQVTHFTANRAVYARYIPLP